MKTCVVCGEEFELKPDKPGFANRCLDCSMDESAGSTSKDKMSADQRQSESEMNEARRRAIRDMLYRKDS